MDMNVDFIKGRLPFAIKVEFIFHLTNSLMVLGSTGTDFCSVLFLNRRGEKRSWYALKKLRFPIYVPCTVRQPQVAIEPCFMRNLISWVNL